MMKNLTRVPSKIPEPGREPGPTVAQVREAILESDKPPTCAYREQQTVDQEPTIEWPEVEHASPMRLRG